MEFQPNIQWQIIDAEGRRKYLSAGERRRFLAVVDAYPATLRALAYVLAFSGCRISEALAVTRRHVDAEAHRLILRTLKRRKLVYRAVPLPKPVIDMLLALAPADDAQLWPIHRATAYRHIKRAMMTAGIDGPMACCRGLRHGFGIHAASSRVPPNLVTKWMGHASGSTTAIYLDAVGWEEREFAARMWDT